MNADQSRVAGALLFSIAIFASGFWLTRSGRPYNGILFNVHKFIVLAAAVLFAMTLYQTQRAAPLGTMELAAAVVTGLLVVGLMVTGGLLSASKHVPAIPLRVHHIMPYPALLFAALTLYALLSRTP